MKNMQVAIAIILCLLGGTVSAMDDGPPYFPDGFIPPKGRVYEANVWISPQEFELEGHHQFVIFNDGITKCTADFEDTSRSRYPGEKPKEIDFSYFQSAEDFLVPMLLATEKKPLPLGHTYSLIVEAMVGKIKIEGRFPCLEDSLAVRLIKVGPTTIEEVNAQDYEARHPNLDSCEHHLRKKKNDVDSSASQST